jgi:HAD superfamily hydrolase (TIGR01509 family)
MARRDLGSVDAVVFDTDGVLTRTADVHAAAWAATFDAAMAERGAAGGGGDLRPFTDEDYLRSVDGRPRYDGVAQFLAARGIELPWGDPDDPPGTATVCGWGNRKDVAFREELATHGARPYDTTVEFVDRLREVGVAVVAVSASRNQAAVLESAGLLDRFDARVDGVESADLDLAGKPAPDLFLEGARRVGVPPGRAAVLEDALPGVAAGRAGGFAVVIGVDRGGQGQELADAGAHLVVTDARQLAVRDDRHLMVVDDEVGHGGGSGRRDTT